MQTHSTRRSACVLLPLLLVLSAGCEGIARSHDDRVADINPPPEEFHAVAREDLPNFPDLVENMVTQRQAFIRQLIALERAYLLAGNTTKANWARRQRELTEAIEVYPYLTDTAPEHSLAVHPEEQIPEADALYAKGTRLLEDFRGVPFTGYLKDNQRKAREALALFKRVLAEYPKSDKVDDCAYHCGEIYKEYLRDDDPDNELAVRYYRWAVALDPQTPHPARFDCAVVYDFRLHIRDKALELYHQVLETEEAGNESNQRFAATRIEQLTDDDTSHLRPVEPNRNQNAGAQRKSPVTAKLPEGSAEQDNN